MLDRLLLRLRPLLFRRRPLFRYSWRFLLPCSGFVALHRSVILDTLAKRPELAWVFIWQCMTWSLYWHWFLMYKASKHYHHQASNDGVTRYLQVVGLLRAGLGQGISAFDFYHFKLYQYPPHRWWEYVFDFQLPYFHHSFQSATICATSRDFLTNKHTFYSRLAAVNGQAVPSLAHIALTDIWPIDEWLNQSAKVFIKPVAASRSQGCVILSSAQDWVFEFAGQIYCASEGLASLKLALPMGDYVVQPLLENHPQMLGWQRSDSTITLRVISCMDQGLCRLIVANLELNDEGSKRWRVFAIDVDNGGLVLDAEYCKQCLGLVEAQHLTIPFWSELQAEIMLAHSLCADVHTVGWDAVITPQGPRLLEGNLNWGVNPLQAARQAPLLPVLCRLSSQFHLDNESPSN